MGYIPEDMYTQGKHKGVWNPDGKQIKPPVPGRRIDPIGPPGDGPYNWNHPAPWALVGASISIVILWESSRAWFPARNLVVVP